MAGVTKCVASAPIPPGAGRLSSPFGPRKQSWHSGIDLAAPEGTPVLSVLEGEVFRVYRDGEMDRYGNAVLIAHSPTLLSLYAHQQSINVHA